MVASIYLLCAITAAFAAAMLFRAFQKNRLRVLLLSGWCFVGLTITNLIVVADKVLFPTIDLLALRLGTQLLALSLLLIGLLWGDE